jgi:hypothetical protein
MNSVPLRGVRAFAAASVVLALAPAHAHADQLPL